MTSIAQDLGKIGVSPQLPVHFFTIVLNGQPFIQYHLQVFQELKLPWHWHIIEGVAELKHDTAWSVAQGGCIDSSLHRDGLSIDGTTEYLDSLVQCFPEQITLYRPPPGQFWDGKREMVNAPLSHIQEECLLWQIDADELWTARQISTAYKLFQENPERTAAFYWCHYFVGAELVVASRYCYTQNPDQEWLRTWRYQPGMSWAKHEPPQLVTLQGQDVGRLNPFTHAETEAAGLIFQHYAYVIPAQLTFKAKYYGYTNALEQWQRLQSEPYFPVFLSEYLGWVTDDTIVEQASSLGIIPIAIPENNGQTWHFRTEVELTTIARPKLKSKPKIAVDGVFFQINSSGISRVWRSIFQEWAKSGFSDQILILDRAKTAPRVPGFRYRLIHPYNQDFTGQDSLRLEEICDKEGIELFISTYYTTPVKTPTVLLVHDMIPEVLGFDLTDLFLRSHWREKELSILYASSYLTVSQNTQRDLVKFFPGLDQSKIHIAYNGLDRLFKPASDLEISTFKQKFNIHRPYFLIVGDRFGFNGYKNTKLFFQAFKELPNRKNYQIFCAGGRKHLEPELEKLVPPDLVTIKRLSDIELAIAYSGAIALVYPSRYEGFGLPILEAMACGCPVITCYNSSIPEVAGDAAIYVDEGDPKKMLKALIDIQVKEIRNNLIELGFQQCRKFSWTTMASIIADVLIETKDQALETKKTSEIFKKELIWHNLRQIQAETKTLVTSLNKRQSYTPESLEHLLHIIQEMESTKFWKLRQLAQLLQKFMGRSGPIDEVIVDPKQSSELQFIQAQQKIKWMKTSKFWQLRRKWLTLREKIGIPGDHPDSPLT